MVVMVIKIDAFTIGYITGIAIPVCCLAYIIIFKLKRIKFFLKLLMYKWREK